LTGSAQNFEKFIPIEKGDVAKTSFYFAFGANSFPLRSPISGYTEPVDLMALYERFDELLGESVKVPKVGDRMGFFLEGVWGSEGMVGVQRASPVLCAGMRAWAEFPDFFVMCIRS